MPTIHPRYECILLSIQRICSVIFPTRDDSQSSRIGGGNLQIVDPPSSTISCSSFDESRIDEQIHDTSTPKEFLDWARSTSRITDPDERNKLLGDGTGFVIQERKEYLKWAHPTSTMTAPVEHKRRFLKWSSHSTSTVNWSLQEEISKLFETTLKLIQEEINQNEMALKYGCSDLKQEHGRSYEELGGGCGTPTTLAHSRDMFVQDVMDMFQGEGGVINGNFTFPIDSKKVKEDLLALWFGLCEHKADWILYVTPLPQLEYIEMCFTWISSDRHKPPKTSYAGYRIGTTELEDNLFDKAKARWVAMEQGIPEAAKLLGYTAEAVFDCVFTFTVLKNHRLAVWVFDIDEMFNEEGNTFVYLLNTRAKIHFCKDINELKKASKLILEEMILEKAKGWEKGEERMLRFHLLEFTENERKNLNLLDDSNYSSQSGVP
ncbi:arginine--tRNA ligase, chloroplastic/mitochondrial [Tanacetum coccineum]